MHEELLQQVLPPRPASAWSWPEAEAANAWSSEAACPGEAQATADADAEAASAKATDAQAAAAAKEAVSLPPGQRRGQGRQQKLIHTMGWIGQSSSEALILVYTHRKYACTCNVRTRQVGPTIYDDSYVYAVGVPNNCC